MSPTKKGRKNQTISGRSFRSSEGSDRIGAGGFAAAIAAALRKDFGDTRSAIKTIVSLTTANERAVKNWFEGRNGPSGEFLILLCRHSDQVLETVLLLAGRRELVTAKKLVDAKGKLREMLMLLDELEKQ
jgi:hypothetical protein